jgi:2',3'-cyclic-nucleotide 2'-phosphodiesterase (5'-nucleotidase family)
VPLRLLHYSDVENAFDDPDRVARLAGLIRQRRQSTDAPAGDDAADTDTDHPALVFGTGDCTGPGVLALTTDGEQALDFFEAVKPDASTLGNHDFDHGFDRTRDLLARSPQPWVVSNVETGDSGSAAADSRFAADHTMDRLLLNAGDDSVGVVGVLDPAMSEFAPHLSSLRFSDPIEAVDRHGSALRVAGADHLVVLSHATDDCDDRIASETDADVLLGGHTHVERVETVAGTLVVQPPGGGGHLVEVELGSDGATATAEPTATADATDTPQAVVHAVDDAPPVESLAGVLRARIAETGLDETVDHVEAPIHRDRDACRVAESRVGNLVADAYRWAGEADVGVVPPGFIRTDEPITGAVRRLDLLALAPYGGELVTAELSGTRLRRVFRDLAAARTHEAFPTDWLGHVSGVTVRWRAEPEGPGELVSATVAGEEIRDEETYRLASAEYTVVTDTVFPALDEDAIVDRSGPSYETVVSYGREHGVTPTVEGRIRHE